MTTTGLSDLDQLVFSVRDRESSRLIQEAVAAYRGGALRSAIMSVWIAVAYDIICKARELAAQGEATPKIFITKLDNAISGPDHPTLAAIERDLLKIAKDDFQFFAPHEFNDLNRLKEDRNLCAHPAFISEDNLFQPAPELVRAHIVHAINHLLRHAPLQGKNAIDRIEIDLLSASFPTTPQDIEIFLRQRYLERAKESLVIVLLKSLLVRPIGADHAKYVGKERQIAAALVAVGRIKPVIYERELPAFVLSKADSIGDNRILAFVRMIAIEPRLWEWIGNAAQIRIARLVGVASPAQIKEFDLFDGLQIQALKTVVWSQFTKQGPDWQQSVIAEQPQAEFADYVPVLYARAGSFRHAEALGVALILPMTRFLNASHIDGILAAAETNGQIRLAGATSAILEDLYENTRTLLPQSGVRWVSFIDKLTALGGAGNAEAYEPIRKHLIKDGLIKP